MISRAATILAIILPLGLCLFVALSVVVILVIRFTRAKSQLAEQLKKQQKEIHEQKEKLDKWFTRFQSNIVDTGANCEELEQSYKDNYWCIQNDVYTFINKWISEDIRKPSTSDADEAARLEAALLVGPPPAFPSKDPDRNYSIFPNAQKWTAAELVARFRSTGRIRCDTMQQIIVSILLKNTSLNGDPCATLLLLDPEDIDGLYNIHKAVRNGLRLFDTLTGYICRFGYFKAKSEERSREQRQRYYKLFDDIFKLYYKSNSEDDWFERLQDINKMLDAAIAHGMTCLTFKGDIEYRWNGRKQEPFFELAPTMVAKFFTYGKHEWKEMVLIEGHGWDLLKADGRT